MDHDIDPRFGWLVLVVPTFLKLLIKWSGTNHPHNPIWKAMNFLENGIWVLALVAFGFWLGHLCASSREQTLEKKLNRLLEEKLSRALSKSSNEIHESYKKRDDERKSFEQQISDLRSDLYDYAKKYNWLKFEYKELKSLTTRTAADANKDALQAVIE